LASNMQLLSGRTGIWTQVGTFGLSPEGWGNQEQLRWVGNWEWSVELASEGKRVTAA
jgi:hypothetical protein